MGKGYPHGRGPLGICTTHIGSEYTPEQLEFLKAIDALKRGRPFPTWIEVLNLLKSMGYKRPAGKKEKSN